LIADYLNIAKGGRRMASVDYLITTRAIRDGQFVAGVGSSRYLRVPSRIAIPTPEMAAPNARDQALWVKEVRDLADGDPNQINKQSRASTNGLPVEAEMSERLLQFLFVLALMNPVIVSSSRAADPTAAPPLREEMWALLTPLPMFAYVVRPVGGGPFSLVV
jgi:hypothetical protein